MRRTRPLAIVKRFFSSEAVGVSTSQPLPAGKIPDGLPSESVAAITGYRQGAEISSQAQKLRRKGLVLKIRDKRPIILSQRARNAELERKAAESKLPWRIMSSVVLHRFPIVSKDLEPWQQQMIEVQNYVNKQKKEYYMSKTRGTPASITSVLEFTPEELMETLPFTPAPRVTKDDETDNRQSFRRQYQQSLFLVVKRSRQDNAWQFPQGKWLAEETLRQSADRVLGRACNDMEREISSNAPIGYYMYEYPKEEQEKRGNFGAKVFFYHSHFDFQTPNFGVNNQLYEDHHWIGRKDVYQYFNKDTAHFLFSMLPW